MDWETSFDEYLEHLCNAIGHSARRAGLVGYCQGLMLPIARKSVEPLAAHIEPHRVSARHQSLHHFVSKSEWSDAALIEQVRRWVLPHMDPSNGLYWIIDDTGFPKKGKHSVGVARQYCGQLGKQDNCQVAVSLSVATGKASLPVAWQLYLPQEWVEDPTRRRQAGVPEEIRFATKPQIAITQLHEARQSGAPNGVVLADAGYGNDTVFRDAVGELGLQYAVGIQSSTRVWPPGLAPLPAEPSAGKAGRPRSLQRRVRGHDPVPVKDLALALEPSCYRKVSWREGTRTALTSRFAALRVRASHRDYWRATPRDEEWLLIEWPVGEPEPIKYWFSTLPEDTSVEHLVDVAKMRWRIERDYQDLKQECGLGHFEGRGWRGFHHHASLCIAAYGFLVAQRLIEGGGKKNSGIRSEPALPADYIPRGSPTHAATRT